ncbi:MFS transporter [Massilia sp. W12]|uniref:MFS transporter n=1 Tax=Massilia sp. W12 TaxID=3126507 RepID=UPI0030D3AC56
MKLFPYAFFFFAYYGYVGIFSPFGSLYFAAQGMSPAQIGIIMAVVQGTRIIGPNVWGALADARGARVRILRYTAVLALAAFACMFWAQGFLAFLLLMLLINTFTSASGPLSEAALVGALKENLNQFGRLRLWGSVGFIVTVTAAGKLLEVWGIQSFVALCCAMLLLVVASAWTLRETPLPPVARNKTSFTSLLRLREVQAFLASACLMVMAHSALYVFYSLFLEQLGFSKLVIGLMWSLGVVAEIVFFFFQAPLFARLGLRLLMLGSLALAVLRFLMIGVAQPGIVGLVLLIIAQILHAATFGVHHSSCVQQLQRWFGGALQARGQALYVSMSYGLGGTLGGILLGPCWEAGGAHMVFFVAAGMSGAGLALAWLSLRWQAQRDRALRLQKRA